eukprot:5034637-Prymnesium_polylepis.1
MARPNQARPNMARPKMTRPNMVRPKMTRSNLASAHPNMAGRPQRAHRREAPRGGGARRQGPRPRHRHPT